jgi:hypothetical protein
MDADNTSITGEFAHRWSSVISVVREFEAHLAHNAPKLQIVNAIDREWSYEEYRQRKREFRICSGKGVYLIFDVEDRLQYVGLAMNAFDDRIWSHDEYVPRKWTDVIAFPDDWCFIAPALECFLIAKLKPPGNSHYRSLAFGERTNT